MVHYRHHSIGEMRQIALNKKGKCLSENYINIDVKPGEFVSLIGPSGCGKTTLLRLIAGLDQAQSGDIYLDNEKISGTHFERGYVFQHANLFPWENIENNIAAGLKARKIYKEKKGDVAHFIELSGLTGFEKSYPHQLSGGMAQRASLARALINDPLEER